VDGDNLIGSSGGPRSGDDRRSVVVARVIAVCEARQAEACVVFDHHPHGNLPPSDRVSVRVAASGESADDVIRALIDGDADAGRLTVVTSDKPVYSYARTRGAHVLRCHEWRALERRCGGRV
jgi:predicted RNA-binding protein with PIN domain